MWSSSLLLSLSLGLVSAKTLPPHYRIDAHRHVITDSYRAALIDAGFDVLNGTLYTDGFPVPAWSVQEHIDTLNLQSVDYSIVGIDGPGVQFLSGNVPKMAALARQVNIEMYNFTQQYPDRVGAYCLLPLPDIPSTLAEIKYCLDVLKFDGVGVLTNYNGVYWGDAVYDPVMQLLSQYPEIPVQIHPNTPGCVAANIGYATALSEFPIESLRAAENLLLTGRRAMFKNIQMILVQGGGPLPFIGPIISGAASLLYGTDAVAALDQFRNDYFFDLSSTTSTFQLAGLRLWSGVGKILIGTDWPYNPTGVVTTSLGNIQPNGNFNSSEMRMINATNVLSNFPNIAKKLGFTSF